ncbi:MAG: hypothetical protein LVR00_05710 [Rhabdochlamydiaceae bacterium]|jgi:hypothetical protein
MYEYVDKFVIVESVETFRGKPKPLFYQENRERYKQFSDKIIHVVLEERQDTTNPWVREAFQRNQIMRGLKDCVPEDIVFISDVDEIVRGSVIPKIVQLISSHEEEVVVCDQPIYRFYLNVKDPCIWVGTCATTFQYLSKIGPEELRVGSDGLSVNGDIKLLYPCIPDAGWHFTSIGGLKVQIEKLEAFSHQESDLPENKTQKAMDTYMEAYCRIVPLDDTFPAYIRDNQKYYRSIGWIYEGKEYKKATLQT